MKRRILVFDTTLRDGEQVPGQNLILMRSWKLLTNLKTGVDIIEAGFPCSSKGDFKAVETIAKK